MMNTVFIFYAMSIHYDIVRTPQLTNEVFSQYEGVAHFSADMHHVFIQARADPQRQCFKLPYVVTKPDIRRIVQQWLAEWLKDLGKKPSILVPPATNIRASTSQAQQQIPLEDSEDPSDSQINDNGQGGDSE